MPYKFDLQVAGITLLLGGGENKSFAPIFHILLLNKLFQKFYCTVFGQFILLDFFKKLKITYPYFRITLVIRN